MEQWRTTTASGYKQVTFGDTRNKSKSYRVNRLVVICFLGLADDTSWVTRHLNGKRDDNRLVNLKPGTPKENCADMLRHGTRMLGSRNPGAIIDEQTAAKIKSDWRPWSRDANKMCIAKRYGVSYSLVDKIVQGERWKHV